MGLLDSIIRIDNEVDAQTELIAQIGTALEGKAAGGGTVETWTFIMEDGSEVTKDVVVA